MSSKNLQSSAQDTIAILSQPSKKRWLRFHNPIDIIQTNKIHDVAAAVANIETRCKQESLHAVGFMSYEAAPAFDSNLPAKATTDFPLIWFALYQSFETIDAKELKPHDLEQSLDWQANITESQYRDHIQRIKHYIHEGDTYQVNYSFRLNSDFSSKPWDLFCRMIDAQDLIHHDGYCAFIETDDWAILSASPELFIHYQASDRSLLSLPMKGTAPRGRHYAQDQHNANQLQLSQKNRAENIMITDMVRNDCGKIADIGSVHVSNLLKLNQYPTFWTLTSAVHANCDYDLQAILSALFPAASITGAPKRRAMEIIDELEDTARLIYTGSIGMINADEIQLNVAIRTVLINKHQAKANFGVGGGIVWDSHSEDEFAECATKANVLTYRAPQFELMTTLLWQQDHYVHLALHLTRLIQSAQYFHWELDISAIEQALNAHAKAFGAHRKRVRLCITRAQEIHITSEDFTELATDYRIALAENRVNSNDYFLHHKTTYRVAYDNAYSEQDSDDIVLINEHGNITETRIANIIIHYNGQWMTPDLDSGLLNGIGRQVWLQMHPDTIEQAITPEMLKQADKIYLTNAVRGVWQAQLLTTSTKPSDLTE